MLNLLGEYHCRIDAKGRVSFPAKLRKQLDRVLHDGLVVNRDIFEGCLVIYPKPEWDKVNAEMSRLSRYDRSHQLFQRKFMKGATLVEVDGSGRLLVRRHCWPRWTRSRSGGDCVVTGLGEKIEVWSKARFEQQVLGGEDDFDFGALAEKVRQDIDPARNPNDSSRN